MNDLFRFIVSIVLVSVACSGVAAIMSTIIITKVTSSFEKRVEQEVNRRLRKIKIVPKLNVHMTVIDESHGGYERT